ncbi:MAG TPA: hypothetical protein VM577_06355, partial [Anaerovoracaceae bacterium]|nr:hypothetical protein [Anaerovoracaceae bacterium]
HRHRGSRHERTMKVYAIIDRKDLAFSSSDFMERLKHIQFFSTQELARAEIAKRTEGVKFAQEKDSTYCKLCEATPDRLVYRWGWEDMGQLPAPWVGWTCEIVELGCDT